MRYKAVQKEASRQKIIEAAGRSFRKNGYAGTGVDGLAKAAGATSGAFYTHFASKDEAFNIALAVGLDEVIEAVPQYQHEHGTHWVKAFVHYYLGRQHRNNLDCGCAMPTLISDVVRAGTKVHAAFEEKMILIANLVACGLAGTSEECHTRAWALLSLLIGGLSVSRAMKSGIVADEVAEAITIAAIKAAGRTRSTKRQGL